MIGYAESTVICLIKEVRQAIFEILWEENVTKLFPKSQEDIGQALTDMESEWHFRFAFAAIDGSHVPIKCLPGRPESMTPWMCNPFDDIDETLLQLSLKPCAYGIRRCIW